MPVLHSHTQVQVAHANVQNQTSKSVILPPYDKTDRKTD